MVVVGRDVDVGQRAMDFKNNIPVNSTFPRLKPQSMPHGTHSFVRR
jgi:hypothetical protein